jgi:hypothetical protein
MEDRSCLTDQFGKAAQRGECRLDGTSVLRVQFGHGALNDLTTAIPAIGDASPRGRCELEPRGSRVVGVGTTGEEPGVDETADERAHRVGHEAERFGGFPHPRAGALVKQHDELDLGIRERPVRPIAVDTPTNATPQTQDDLHQLPRHVA